MRKFDYAFMDSPGEPRTLVEATYLRLRRDIIEGRLPPGANLRVEHLKDDYEIGAGTLREALSLLLSDALVVTEGSGGVIDAYQHKDEVLKYQALGRCRHKCI